MSQLGMLDRPDARRARRHLTLLDMLTWTYRDQLAHHYLRRELDWFIQVLSEERMLGDDAPRAQVHPDAALVHAAVMREVRVLRRQLRLGRATRGELQDAEQRAGLIIHYAAIGGVPERSVFDDRPFGWGCDPGFADPGDRGRLPLKPSHVEPLNLKFSSYGWFERADGTRICYAKLADEHVTVAESEWQVEGRKKVKQSTRQIKVAIEYCPIDWRPGQELIAMTNRMADDWEAAIAALGLALAGAEFRSHVLVSAEELEAA